VGRIPLQCSGPCCAGCVAKCGIVWVSVTPTASVAASVLSSANYCAYVYMI
jgi:hypothetical protein